MGVSRSITAGVLAALTALAAGCITAPDGEPEVHTAALQVVISIDAVALTKQTLMVAGFPAFDSKTVHQLPLSTGTNYALEVGNGAFIGYFSVTACGTVVYDAALNNTVFNGSGTTTLGVVAHSVAFDGRQLTPQNLLIGGFPAFPSTAVQTFQFPAVSAYAFETGTGGFVAYFGVRGDGTVSYDAALNNTVFRGAGTATLAIVPHTIAIDGTALLAQSLILAGVTSFASATPASLQLASAVSYVMELGSSGPIGYFNVAPAGTVSYDPSLEGGVYTGAGTATLGIVPHAITIDATALSQQQLRIVGFPSFDSKTVQHDPLPSAVNYALIGGNGALIGYFHIAANGTLDYAAAYDAVFAGRGTATLALH